MHFGGGKPTFERAVYIYSVERRVNISCGQLYSTMWRHMCIGIYTETYGTGGLRLLKSIFYCHIYIYMLQTGLPYVIWVTVASVGKGKGGMGGGGWQLVTPCARSAVADK